MSMTLGVFLKLVEIQTKLASLFPFLIGVLFSLNYFGTINWLNTLVFFVGMLVFDMTTTAINNFMDYKKAKDETYKREVNIVGQAKLKERQVSRLIIFMLIISAIVGLFLTYRTGWLLLVMGGICCFIGVFYTYGPVPLSRMPLGELFSGVTMGFGIFMMTVYINAYQLKFFYLQIENWKFMMVGDLKILLMLLFASMPMVFTIANIMLANNLCDMEEDIKNHRYTLPYYIGRDVGLKLFNCLMYACYLVVIFGVVLQIYKWPVLIVLLTFPLINKNMKCFGQEQVKAKTFIISIKNLVIFNVVLIIGMVLSLLLK